MAKSSGKSSSKGPIVGYGDKGKAFHNQTKYNVSKSGQAHAKNPSLSKAPLAYGKKGNAFFSKGQVASHPSAGLNKKSPQQPHLAAKNPSAGQVAHFKHAEAGKPTITPKVPKGMGPKTMRI